MRGGGPPLRGTKYIKDSPTASTSRTRHRPPRATEHIGEIIDRQRSGG